MVNQIKRSVRNEAIDLHTSPSDLSHQISDFSSDSVLRACSSANELRRDSVFLAVPVLQPADGST